MQHPKQHNLFSNFQHKFMRRFSTVTQLPEFVNHISSALDSGEQVYATFIDFSKAFDMVPHSKLTGKLNTILTNPLLFKWISDFLSDPPQCVAFNISESNRSSVTSGVCRGSILGPLLYLLQINNLPNTSLAKSGFMLIINTVGEHYFTTVSLKHNAAFSRLRALCKTWQMAVNFRETVSMCFTNKRSPSNFTYSSTDINLQKVSEYKYIGIILASNLSWSTHVEYIKTRNYVTQGAQSARYRETLIC